MCFSKKQQIAKLLITRFDRYIHHYSDNFTCSLSVNILNLIIIRDYMD